MEPIRYVDRVTGKEEIERVYGAWALKIFYGDHPFFRAVATVFLPFVAKLHFFSSIYGWFQKRSGSRKKIQPFIASYGIDVAEFEKKPEEFASFNDFFIRKLKPTARPIAAAEKTAIFFADGRYLFYPDLKKTDGFLVKGSVFSLAELLKSQELAKKYEGGSMAIARLCPTDYHRFHFPCDGVPEAPRLINGALFSVNPWALKKNIHILSENKRMLTQFRTKHFGDLIYIEIGATSVGTIVQTYTPFLQVKKGAEKGYFSFGGSCVIVLFERHRILFDADLLRYSSQRIEVKGLLGQSMGSAINPLLP